MWRRIGMASICGVSLLGGLACSPNASNTASSPTAKKDAKRDIDRTCADDDDCVMSCVAETDCCPNPCGCDVVRHVDEHAAVRDKQIAYCSDKIEECPATGACDPNYPYAVPTCVEGQCVGKKP